MSLPRKTKIAAVAFACAALFFVGALALRGPQAHVVVLTDGGFVPEELAVDLGATVIFRTDRDAAFWPASDPHPTHGAYPGFDPRVPVDPGASWSFVFDAPGTWDYHDHLAPQFTGTIVVRGGSGAAELSCDDLEQGSARRHRCRKEAILGAMEGGDVGAAFDVLERFFRADPSFVRDCHGYAHDIGEEAYRYFSRYGAIALTEKTTYCGYGFYHGFMETLLFSSGNIEEAREFCAYADRQLRQAVSGAAPACYHGIGHGAVDGADERTWGDAEAMMAAGFALCDAVAENDFQYYLCATGVFNALEILSADHRYRLSRVREDPFDICHGYERATIREACYTNMIPAVLRLYGNDLARSAGYMNERMARPDEATIDGFTVREMVILSLFHELMRLRGDESGYVDAAIEACRALPEHSRIACVRGASGGHMKYGEPNRAHEKWLAFCSDARWRADERDACFGYVIDRLRVWYSPERSGEICRMAIDRGARENMCESY